MGEAERQILQMLEEGIVTAEEASNLLTALKPGDTVDTIAGDAVLRHETIADEGPPRPPPNMDRYRRLWLIPLIVAGGSLVLASAGLVLMYQSSENVALLGFLCVWSIFIVALLATAVILLAQRSTWLYLNVEEKDGTRIRFAMPMPLGIVNWGVRMARPFVPKEQRANLEMAAAFATAMKDDPNREPISVDVDDEDGDKVQIYIG
jgi:hypothetical protein